MEEELARQYYLQNKDMKIFSLHYSNIKEEKNYESFRAFQEDSYIRKWNCIFHNETEFNLLEYLSKKKYYSKSIDYYTKKWGRNDPDIRKQMGIWYRFFGVFLERGKWKQFILNPHLILGIYLLRFLVGLQFLRRNFP